MITYVNPAVAAVSHIDIALSVRCDAVRRIELARAITRLAPGFQPFAVRIHLGHARIDVTIADIDVARGIPGHVRHLTEHTVNCRQRGLSAEEAVALIVNGFVKDVLQHLPMEFAVEAQKLISICLDGSVG